MIKKSRGIEHTNGVRRRINRHYNVGLGNIVTLKFLVGITTQQQNIHAWTGQNAACKIGIGIFLTVGATNCLTNNRTYRTREVDLIIAKATNTQNDEKEQKAYHHTRPDRHATLLFPFTTTRIFARRAIASLLASIPRVIRQ